MIISHQERILRIADEIIMIKNGELAARGTADEILPLLTGTDVAAKTCNVAEIWKGGTHS